MDQRTGRLFDLATDGLGFIADSENGRIWAFLLSQCDFTLTEDPVGFAQFEDTPVHFSVDGGKVVSIQLGEATQTATAWG